MPTIRPHHYKAFAVVAAVALIFYGIYTLYSRSEGALIKRAQEALKNGETALAEETIRLILERNSNQLDALIMAARLSQERSDFVGMNEYLTRVLQIDENFLEARRMMVDVYVSQCRFDEVEKEVERISKLGKISEDEQAWVLLSQTVGLVGVEGSDLVWSNNVQKAQEMLAVNPELIGARMVSALYLMEVGEYQKALSEAQLARRQYGNGFVADWILGKASFLNGEREQALMVLNRADQLRKTRRDLAPPVKWNMQLYLYMALASIEQGRLADGERLLDTALQNDPDAIEPRQALVNLYLLRAFQQEDSSASDREGGRFYRRAVDELESLLEVSGERTIQQYQLALTHIYLNDYRSALEILESLVNREEPYQEALLDIGDIHISQVNYVQAVEVYREVLKHFPEHPNANYNLGTLLVRNREMESAREFLRQVVEKETANQWAKLNFGVVSRLLGHYAEAENCYQGILKEDPNNMDALIGLGLIALTKQDHETAKTLFSDAKTKHGENAEPIYYLGRVAYERGEISQARQHFDECLTIDPANEYAIMAQVRILLGEEKWQAVQEYLKPLVEDTRSKINAVAKNLSALSDIMLGNLTEAEEKLDELSNLSLQLNPVLSGAVHSNVMLLKRAEKDLKQADAEAEIVTRMTPDNSIAFYNQGIIKYEQGDLSGAVAALRRAEELDPSNNQIIYNLAICLVYQQMWAEANQRIEKLVEGGLINSAEVIQLLNIYLRNNRDEELATLIAKMEDNYPASWQLDLLKGQFLLKQDNVSEALVLTERLVKSNPTQDQVQLLRGMALSKAGQFSESVVHLRSAWQDKTGDAEKRYNLAVGLIAAGGIENLEEAGALLKGLKGNEIPLHLIYNQQAFIKCRQSEMESARELLNKSLQLEPRQAEIEQLLDSIGKI